MLLCFGVDRFSFPALWILLRWEDFGMDDNMANREMPGTEIDPMQSQKPPQRQKPPFFSSKGRLCSISDVGFMVPQYSIDSYYFIFIYISSIDIHLNPFKPAR